MLQSRHEIFKMSRRETRLAERRRRRCLGPQTLDEARNFEVGFSKSPCFPASNRQGSRKLRTAKPDQSPSFPPPAPMNHLFSSLPLERWLNAGVLLAVSGGADSVGLLRFFVQRRSERLPHAELAVAHVNHGLRGAESDADAAFVRELAREFRLPYSERTIDPAEWTADATGSFEAAARDLRYAFLKTTAEENGLRLVAVAHTRDDQIETVLHRIIRGTGIAGLAGIPPVRPLGEAVSIIRPLLDVARSEVLEYLETLGQGFRTDSSNLAPDWTRNRIRLELLPLLKERFNPNVEQALSRLGRLAGELQEIVEHRTADFQEQAILRISQEETVLDLDRLRQREPYFVRELFLAVWTRNGWPLQAMGFEQWSALANLVRSQTPEKRLFPGGVVVCIDPRSATVRLQRSSIGGG